MNIVNQKSPHNLRDLIAKLVFMVSTVTVRLAEYPFLLKEKLAGNVGFAGRPRPPYAKRHTNSLGSVLDC